MKFFRRFTNNNRNNRIVLSSPSSHKFSYYKPEKMRCGRLTYHGFREIATLQKVYIVEVESFIRRARVDSE